MKQLLKTYLESVIAGQNPSAQKPTIEKLDVVVKFTDQNVWMADEPEWCFPSGFLFEKLTSLKEQGNTNLSDELNGCMFTLDYPFIEMNINNPKIKSNHYLDIQCAKFNIKALEKHSVHYSFAKEYLKDNAGLRELAEKALQKTIAEKEKEKRPPSTVINRPYKDPMMAPKSSLKPAEIKSASSTSKDKKEVKPTKKPAVSKEKRANLESSTAETVRQNQLNTRHEDSQNTSASDAGGQKNSKEGPSGRSSKGQPSTSTAHSLKEDKPASKGKGGKTKSAAQASTQPATNSQAVPEHDTSSQNSKIQTSNAETADNQSTPSLKSFESALSQCTSLLSSLPALKCTMSIPLSEDIDEFRKKLRELELLRTEFLQSIWAQVIEADSGYLSEVQQCIGELLSTGTKEMQGQVQAAKKSKSELKGVAEMIESRKVELEVVDNRLREVSDRFERLNEKYNALKGRFARVESEIKRASDERKTWESKMRYAQEDYDSIRARYEKMKIWISSITKKLNLGKDAEIELKKTLGGAESVGKKDREGQNSKYKVDKDKNDKQKPVVTKASSRRPEESIEIVVDADPANKSNQKKPAIQRVYAESSSTQSRVVATGHIKTDDFVDEANKDKNRKGKGYQNPTHYEDVDGNPESSYLGKRKIIVDDRKDKPKVLNQGPTSSRMPIQTARVR